MQYAENILAASVSTAATCGELQTASKQAAHRLFAFRRNLFRRASAFRGRAAVEVQAIFASLGAVLISWYVEGKAQRGRVFLHGFSLRINFSAVLKI